MSQEPVNQPEAAARALLRREISAWGTVITLDAVAGHGQETAVAALLDAALPQVEALTQRIDRIFSSWRADSLTTALRNSQLQEAELAGLGDDGDAMLEVIEQCRVLRTLTRGIFDPWQAPGGFDPSGYVKGWGAEQIADLLVAAGVDDICVNAAGDIALRGQGPAADRWRIGVVHPQQRDQYCATVELGGQATQLVATAAATSGFSEQDRHIVHPLDSARRARATQATVIGPSAGIADALATALLLEGVDGSVWFEKFAKENLDADQQPVWGALVVQDDSLWRMGACL